MQINDRYITKCEGWGCPNQEKCLRYTITAQPMHLYYVRSPIMIEGRCDMFIDNKEEQAYGE